MSSHPTRITALTALATLAASAAAAGHAAADRQPSTVVTIDGGRHPLAVCNNGEAATYAYALTSDRSGDDGVDYRKKWLIVLSGGGECHDAESCANRWAERPGGRDLDGGPGNHFNMVPGHNPVSFDGHGILDLDGHPAQRGPRVVGEHASPFRDPSGSDGFNRIWVFYCSSDLWQGTGAAIAVDPGAFPAVSFDAGQPALTELRFNGARIVDAVVSLVMSGQVVSGGRPGAAADPDFIPDAAHGELVIAGSSAGGNGTLRNLDAIAGAVARGVADEFAAAPGVVVWGVADAALAVGARRTDEGDTAAAAFYTGGHPEQVRNDDGCQDDADHRCFSIDYVARDEVTTPYFVVQQAFDALIHAGIKTNVTAAIRTGGPALAARYPALAARARDRSLAPAAAAEAYLRAVITRGAATIGAARGNPAGLFVPNYQRGWHQLMADSERFFTSEAMQWRGGDHPGSPRLGQPYQRTTASIPTALAAFRGCLLDHRRDAAGRATCVTGGGDATQRARVVNTTAEPPRR